MTLNADGTFSYTPDADYNGADTFVVTVDDGHGGSIDVTVPITITPVNDAPVANNDSGSTDVGTATTVNVLSNDSDLDGDTLQVIAATADHGSVMINADGSLTFIAGRGL